MNIPSITFEILWIFILALYVFFIVYLTKKIFEYLIKKNVEKDSAVYYDRKLVHIFAGGVVAFFVPFIFTSPWFPLICGIGISVITYFTHKSGRILYWFQNDNLNDVSFCLMWSLGIFVLWYLTDNPWIGVIPALFMSFGDGMTGIVRNKIFNERNKHYAGNILMVFICIPIGLFFAGNAGIPIWGVIAAVVASVVEKFEFGSIDDNVFITVFSILILIIGMQLGPLISY